VACLASVHGVRLQGPSGHGTMNACLTARCDLPAPGHRRAVRAELRVPSPAASPARLTGPRGSRLLTTGRWSSDRHPRYRVRVPSTSPTSGRPAPAPPARQASRSPGPPPQPSPHPPFPAPGKPAGQRADAGACTLSSAANVKPAQRPPRPLSVARPCLRPPSVAVRETADGTHRSSWRHPCPSAIRLWTPQHGGLQRYAPTYGGQ